MFFFKLLKVKRQIYCVEEGKRIILDRKNYFQILEENQAYNHQE